MTYGTFAPASFWRRKAHLVRNPVRSPIFGVILAPEGASRTESRREPQLRRRFLAGGRIAAAMTYGTFAPASFWRRKAHLVRNPVRSPIFGVILAPEGASRTESRREPQLRRRFLAGGRFLDRREPTGGNQRTRTALHSRRLSSRLASVASQTGSAFGKPPERRERTLRN